MEQPLGDGRNEAHASGVSWAAIVAGAFITAAIALALLALGTGVGFSAVSPWADAGATARAIGWTAIAWLVLMQLVASSVGGYLTGRLRTKWVHVHTHEVFFRDTAHGFLAWAVASVMTAAFLTSAAAVMAGGVARTATGPAASPATTDVNSPDAYVVDTLLRTTAAVPSDTNATSRRGEVGLILANGLRAGALPASDRSYLAQLVAARTGAAPAQAEQQVDAAYAQMQQNADTARKAIAHSMYWTFLALLIGAFCASLAATIGGKERDRVLVV